MENFPKNALENHEMHEALVKLEGYIKDGYFLHGSKKKLDILESRQANGTLESNPESQHPAVKYDKEDQYEVLYER